MYMRYIAGFVRRKLSFPYHIEPLQPGHVTSACALCYVAVYTGKMQISELYVV